jgi:hypothetical protein
MKCAKTEDYQALSSVKQKVDHRDSQKIDHPPGGYLG